MVRTKEHNPCPDGFIYRDGMCVPDDNSAGSRNRGVPAPTPVPPPTPPTPPTPTPPTPDEIITITGLISADVAGILALGTLFGLDLTKDEATQILNGAVVDGFSFDSASGTAGIEVATNDNGVLIGRNGQLLFGDDDGVEMIQFDTTSTPAVYRNIITGEENEELQPLLSNIQNADGTTFNQLIEADGNGIQMQELAGAGADIDTGALPAPSPSTSTIKPDEILEFDDKTLAEWYADNKDTATQEQLDAYFDRLNELTDIALGGDDTEGLVDVDIDAPTPDGVGLSKEQMEALSPEDFRALGEKGGLSTQEIQDYNQIILERTQAENPSVRAYMYGKQQPFSDAQLESMTDEQLKMVLPSMSDEELASLMRINPDFVEGLDPEIIAQMQYDDLIAQAVEQGATDAEIEAMEAGFADAGVAGAEGAVDLPLTILGAGAVGLAWLDGDKEQKKEIAKDVGKTQDWFDKNIVGTTEDVISGTAKAIGEGAKETIDIFTGKVNPFTGKPYKSKKHKNKKSKMVLSIPTEENDADTPPDAVPPDTSHSDQLVSTAV
tara:strand:- start:123 stop:1775 length:1653 start_codon:yes stop_codon:yes gene_type:complete